MRVLNVVQIERGRVADRMPELRALQRRMGSDDVAFNLTTEPEAAPFLDKLTERLATFKQVRDGLADTEIRLGVLAQTTLGHADRYLPRSPARFQRMVDTDGQAREGTFCPLDPGLRQHLAGAFSMIAAEHPAFILVDDDFRLAHPQTELGCFCPLHLDLLARRHETRLNREELLEAVAADSAAGRRVREQWHDIEQQSLLELARLLRAAIDDVDPQVPAWICATPSGRLGNDALAHAFAGQHRPLVRTAGSVYMEASAKTYPEVVDRIMRQRRHLGSDVQTVVEGDTFPHHGFSVSGKKLSAHLVTACVLGMDGVKAWAVPQTSWRGSPNPQFVRTHEHLATVAPALEPLARQARWRGVSMPIRDDESHRLPWSPDGGKEFLRPAWVEVFGRMGIAHVPGGDPRPVRAFSGKAVTGFTHDEWEEFFRDGVLLDGAAAVILTRMGFADHMGIRAETDAELRLSSEVYRDLPAWNGSSSGAERPAMRLHPDGIARLSPTSPATQVIGEYIARPWKQAAESTPLSPSATTYRNQGGGRVAVYAASIDTVRPIQHFIDPFRREQLDIVLRWLGPGEFPVTIDTDTDLYLLAADLPDDGGLLVYALNLQADPIPRLDVVSARQQIGAVQRLDSDGTWAETPVHHAGDRVQIPVDLGYLDHVILRAEFRVRP